MTKLEIFPNVLWDEYDSKIDSLGNDLLEIVENLREAEISTHGFSFYTSVSSVYSSKIEGEEIELDSYVKHKRFGISFLPDYTKKIDDLYSAYLFAQNNGLNQKTISKAHKLLSKHIVAKDFQGKHRTSNMFVSTSSGKIEYVAPAGFEVEAEIKKFYNDLDYLLGTKMSIGQIFFYASWVHLLFVKIHPYNDGNGRTARLLEKWFLAEKIGKQAWFIRSEEYYYKHHNVYYMNLRALGIEYPDLNYSNALPFLLMLPNSLQLSMEDPPAPLPME
jgi:Fic family protein